MSHGGNETFSKVRCMCLRQGFVGCLEGGGDGEDGEAVLVAG